MKNAIAPALVASILYPQLALPTPSTYFDLPFVAKDHAITVNRAFFTSGNTMYEYDLRYCDYGRTLTFPKPLVGIDARPGTGVPVLAIGAAGVVNGQASIYIATPSNREAIQTVDYPIAFLESGSYVPAWTSAATILFGGTFAGSGWVALREYSQKANVMTSLASVRQDTMLTRNPSATFVAIAESNSSSGPASIWSSSKRLFVSTVNTSWFNYEVGISPDGTRLAVPTGNGAFMYNKLSNSLILQGMLGTYATQMPVGVVYSPDGATVYMSFYGAGSLGPAGIYSFDATTLAVKGMLLSYNFPWNGNHALGQGRMTISDDGKVLLVNIAGAVRVIQIGNDLSPATSGACIRAQGAVDIDH